MLAGASRLINQYRSGLRIHEVLAGWGGSEAPLLPPHASTSRNSSPVSVGKEEAELRFLPLTDTGLLFLDAGHLPDHLLLIGLGRNQPGLKQRLIPQS